MVKSESIYEWNSHRLEDLNTYPSEIDNTVKKTGLLKSDYMLEIINHREEGLVLRSEYMLEYNNHKIVRIVRSEYEVNAWLSEILTE